MDDAWPTVNYPQATYGAWTPMAGVIADPQQMRAFQTPESDTQAVEHERLTENDNIDKTPQAQKAQAFR